MATIPERIRFSRERVMNEIEALRWQLERYRALLSQQVDRLHNALEELQRTTRLLIGRTNDPDQKIDEYLPAIPVHRPAGRDPL